MNNDITSEVEKIIKEFEKALEIYEKAFQKHLANKTKLQLKDWSKIPTYLHQELVGDGLSSDLVEEGYQQLMDLSKADPKFLDYMMETAWSFHNNGNEMPDLTTPAGQGLIFEGQGVTAVENARDYTEKVAMNILLDAGFKGTGFKAKHGDAMVWLRTKPTAEKPKGEAYTAYIDFKYSDDTMQMFKITDDKTTFKYGTTEEMTQAIVESLQKGIRSSLSYHGSRNKREWEKEIGISGAKAAKILIYLFKNEGLWSSETLNRNKATLIKNAKDIFDSLVDNKKEIRTNRLWYSSNTVQGGNTDGNES